MTAGAGAALAALRAGADATKAHEVAAYHRAPRKYLGIALPAVDALVAEWRRGASVAERVELARGLWESDLHEARIAAAKLLTQARIPEDEPLVWETFLGWVPDFDGWAIADHACKAGERRLRARPERLDEVEAWTQDRNVWVRRAALVATLPWSKLNHPSTADRAACERILGWAATYVGDGGRFIQKAVGLWLRSLAVRDPERVREFLAGPGRKLRPYARREASRRL
jgi:3-methyladenine DNA glycosylase AlkD